MFFLSFFRDSVVSPPYGSNHTGGGKTKKVVIFFKFEHAFLTYKFVLEAQDGFRANHPSKALEKKSRIRETLNLSTDKDHRTDILKKKN